ncbi:MAG: aa3-type cytochrome c oxidase subunit IV [Alphaproteobacteria bacterium]|nr:MAG: aa3-type cytochrome c oxidase subunit IV [Alphaproteobacteria bacterium]
MVSHRHGDMDIEDHRRTFHGFVKVAIWLCVVSAIVLLFLAAVNA